MLLVRNAAPARRRQPRISVDIAAPGVSTMENIYNKNQKARRQRPADVANGAALEEGGIAVVHIIETDEVEPAVKAALIGLGADLETAQKAAGGRPGRYHSQLVARALDSYAAHLASAGFQQVGTKVEKAAGAGVQKSTQMTELAILELHKRLDAVEHMAVPGGPALRRPATPPPPKTTEADLYRAMAARATDPQLQAGYLAMADEFEAKR